MQLPLCPAAQQAEPLAVPPCPPQEKPQGPAHKLGPCLLPGRDGRPLLWGARLDFLSFRSRPLWRKALSATVLGVPLLLGARYFTAEPQEKRRMRLVVDGVGRFSRSLRIGLQISLDYWWCANVVLHGVEEVCPCILATAGEEGGR
ncbi:hypothetical protein GH733_008220 [Mirounga leonina]|nr:hypothetical protein GH733_008220 [Mirounga leonina]